MNIKSILGAVSLCVLLVFLCGCKDTVKEPERNEVVIKVDIDKADKIYSASMAYYCDGEHCGSPTVINANSSVLSGSYSFVFTEIDFPDGQIPQDFSIEIFLSDSVDGKHISRSAGKVDLGKVAYGHTYEYAVKGDFTEGFGIKNK
ncbi:MAG: hypothetical protein MJ123_03390 [Lachnospiraceae bacterium]|nr:hypothetical protein [Lachnospiraceae bacterium]